MVYSGSLVDTRMSIPTTGSDESLSLAEGSAMSKTQTGRFTGQGSGEWMVYGGSLRRRGSVDASASLPSEGNKESPSVYLMTNPEETGRFGSRGSGEWRVYGGRTGHMSSPARSYILANTEGVENLSAAAQLAASPPPARAGGRFGSAGSGEWRVYGRSAPRLSRAASADRISANDGQVMSLLSSYMSSGPRLSSAGSGGSSSSVVRRSRSVGSGGKLSSSNSADRLSSSPGGHRISCSGRVAYTGSGEWKPVYSSASGRRSSVGSAGRSDGGRTTSSERAQSPAGKMNVSGGSGTASGSKLCGMGSTERVGSRAGGRISSSSGLGRTNSTGGRIISSSDRPIKSTGSGAGGNKERISVCKMAALSISAAGRERSQDRQRQAHRRFQQPTTAKTPLVQRWLTTGVGVTSADPDGLDDIITVTEDLRQ
nr:PREDICTED: sericin 1-like [Paralichthys olivaceus]